KYYICKMLLKSCEESLLRQFPDMVLLVAGGGQKAERIKARIDETAYPDRIRYIGNQLQMAGLYSISDSVVGTGRDALSALSCERPVIAMGSKGIFGLVTPENMSRAMRYYFCDHRALLPMEQTTMTETIESALQSGENPCSLSSRQIRRYIEDRM